ncbi:hypothetical protein ACOME3_000277 [Neoechinorhynchus agilis]
MVFVKVTKNKAYFKRFQVKFRRRRQGKTDYYARRRLIHQDKNKYQTPKYRLVTRITSKDIVAQVIYATLEGDRTICAAYSHELTRYGIRVGLTNYSAAYCVGLLVARRLLKKLRLDRRYTGVDECNGKDAEIPEAETGPNAFRAVLDVGLARTVTGVKIFGIMKGAVDGGLDVPHSDKRYFGYDHAKGSYDAEAHRRQIFGHHVANYMRLLEKQDPDKYNKHFSHYIKEGISPDGIEEMYKKAHAAIRSNPDFEKKPTKVYEKQKRFNRKRLNLKQRKHRVQKVMENFRKGLVSTTA